jgi:hypothetical protein
VGLEAVAAGAVSHLEHSDFLKEELLVESQPILDSSMLGFSKLLQSFLIYHRS